MWKVTRTDTGVMQMGIPANQWLKNMYECGALCPQDLDSYAVENSEVV